MIFLSGRNKTKLFKYKLTSTILLSGIPLNDLKHLKLGIFQSSKDINSVFKADFSDAESIYNGPGLVADNIEIIRLLKAGRIFKLFVGKGLEFVINDDNDNRLVYLSRNDNKNDNNDSGRLLNESLLGPVIIFTLAIDSIFCMHASCVQYKNSAILLPGKSRSGKSTIANYLNDNSGGVFKRLTDDITPLTLRNNQCYVLPHFPQLKLKQNEQYGKDKPGEVKLSHIYLLDKDNRRKSVKIGDIDSGQKIRALISGTVASRLFDKKINTEHLKFCADVINKIKIRKLSYPHNIEKLGELSDILLEDINRDAK